MSVIDEQAREATLAIQGKMVDQQRKKSKGWFFCACFGSFDCTSQENKDYCFFCLLSRSELVHVEMYNQILHVKIDPETGVTGMP